MRRKLARFRRLSSEQRQIVLMSLGLLPAVQLSLRVRGFRWTAGLLGAYSSRQPLPVNPDCAQPVVEAVQLVASRPVVGAKCLGRSLVLWFLLRRRGIDAQLVLGTERPRDGELPAHAWVEVDGIPVNDVADVRERYGSFELQLPRL